MCRYVTVLHENNCIPHWPLKSKIYVTICDKIQQLCNFGTCAQVITKEISLSTQPSQIQILITEEGFPFCLSDFPSLITINFDFMAITLSQVKSQHYYKQLKKQCDLQSSRRPRFQVQCRLSIFPISNMLLTKQKLTS